MVTFTDKTERSMPKLNKDGIDAKRHMAERVVDDPNEKMKEHRREMRDSDDGEAELGAPPTGHDGPPKEHKAKEPKKLRVRTLVDKVIINGHVLKKGEVVELGEDDVVAHRRHGVPLEDVKEGDKVENMKDVSKPYVAKENTETK